MNDLMLLSILLKDYATVTLHLMCLYHSCLPHNCIKVFAPDTHCYSCLWLALASTMDLCQSYRRHCGVPKYHENLMFAGLKNNAKQRWDATKLDCTHCAQWLSGRVLACFAEGPGFSPRLGNNFLADLYERHPNYMSLG